MNGTDRSIGEAGSCVQERTSYRFCRNIPEKYPATEKGMLPVNSWIEK